MGTDVHILAVTLNLKAKQFKTKRVMKALSTHEWSSSATMLKEAGNHKDLPLGFSDWRCLNGNTYSSIIVVLEAITAELAFLFG